MQFQQGIYEINNLIGQKWAYGERIFSVAFLGMLLGLLAGWWKDRYAAALLVSGYIVAAVVPFVSRFSRPALGSDPQGVAIALLPFLALGLAFAYAGRRWSSLL
jgi:hypothetical protein